VSLDPPGLELRLVGAGADADLGERVLPVAALVLDLPGVLHGERGLEAGGGHVEVLVGRGVVVRRPRTPVVGRRRRDRAADGERAARRRCDQDGEGALHLDRTTRDPARANVTRPW
jgi:hypothetical protein